MKKTIMLTLLGLVISAGVHAANWPTFRANYERTGFVQEQAAGPLTQKWTSVNLGGPVVGLPRFRYIGNTS